MPSIAYTNAGVKVNNIDLSAFCRVATLNFGSESLDNTNMGGTTRIKMGGLKTWSFDFTFTQDFTAGGPDATLFGLVGTTACWELRPVNVCSSANNPIYSGVGTMNKYPPMTGAVGVHLETQITVEASGTLGRASSS